MKHELPTLPYPMDALAPYISKETLERLLSYYQLYMEDISDKLISHTEPIDDDLDVLIGEIDD